MENIIENKSFKFAVRTVNLYRHLTENKKGICYFEANSTQWNEYWSERIGSAKRAKQS